MLLLKKSDYDSKNNYKSLWKQKKICDELVTEKKNEINTLIEKINYNDLTCYLKKNKPISFINFNRPLSLLRKIKDGDIELEKARQNQKDFKSGLNEIVKVKEEYKLEEQKSAIKNIKTF